MLFTNGHMFIYGRDSDRLNLQFLREFGRHMGHHRLHEQVPIRAQWHLRLVQRSSLRGTFNFPNSSRRRMLVGNALAVARDGKWSMGLAVSWKKRRHKRELRGY